MAGSGRTPPFRSTSFEKANRIRSNRTLHFSRLVSETGTSRSEQNPMLWSLRRISTTSRETPAEARGHPAIEDRSFGRRNANRSRGGGKGDQGGGGGRTPVVAPPVAVPLFARVEDKGSKRNYTKREERGQLRSGNLRWRRKQGIERAREKAELQQLRRKCFFLFSPLKERERKRGALAVSPAQKG
ncbi:hypothetical protein B296_00036334 [Ensete ventricosum]|uniref:Uncharacterized protein n=1 Tax=Ensete ventricosum TaxID=4639 RepID=A0A426ZCT0_ENSVE|nr:hypothetical protein B296_00036334 [Ensete ventricosum]